MAHNKYPLALLLGANFVSQSEGGTQSTKSHQSAITADATGVGNLHMK
jgi:hypothetical protein